MGRADSFNNTCTFQKELFMSTEVEQIHNYYEHLVLDEVIHRARAMHPDMTADTVADIACVALNQLPARYVRHAVDLVFYLTEEERRKSDAALVAAINHGFETVLKHNRRASGEPEAPATE
jgi:hypothetical protein